MRKEVEKRDICQRVKNWGAREGGEFMTLNRNLWQRVKKWGDREGREFMTMNRDLWQRVKKWGGEFKTGIELSKGKYDRDGTE